MPNQKDIARYLDNWKDEVDGVFLYQTLAKLEKNPELSKVYNRLASVEGQHIHFWENKIKELGGKLPERKQSLRSKTLCFLARRFGARFVLPSVAAFEQAGKNSYQAQEESRHTSLPSDEKSHARILKAINQTSSSGMEGGSLARLEGRHRAMGGNALRAAVLGVNDGLVSNLSLIMGVAGANLSPKSIIVTGFAGLLAGASSMAMGEWLSVQSARELYTRQIEVEAQELKETPKEEETELALIYQAKGVPKEEAEQLAGRLISDEANALNTLAREELGIDPESLGGSAWEASITSFVLFCLGAVVPLLPFLFIHSGLAIMVSLAVSSLALFLVGALITLLTGRSIWVSGTRQLAIGLVAATLTYGIGRWMGQ